MQGKTAGSDSMSLMFLKRAEERRIIHHTYANSIVSCHDATVAAAVV